MKKDTAKEGTAVVIVAAVMTLFVVLVVAGHQSSSPAEVILKGEHNLRKIEDGNGSSFFLFSPDPNKKDGAIVVFSWMTNNGTYAISSLPFGKIKPVISELAEVPTIKFRWYPYSGFWTPNVQKLMDDCVIHAVVTIREGDWPIRSD